MIRYKTLRTKWLLYRYFFILISTRRSFDDAHDGGFFYMYNIDQILINLSI